MCPIPSARTAVSSSAGDDARRTPLLAVLTGRLTNTGNAASPVRSPKLLAITDFGCGTPTNFVDKEICFLVAAPAAIRGHAFAAGSSTGRLAIQSQERDQHGHQLARGFKKEQLRDDQRRHRVVNRPVGKPGVPGKDGSEALTAFCGSHNSLLRLGPAPVKLFPFLSFLHLATGPPGWPWGRRRGMKDALDTYI
jgi:hypothetical protein